MNYIPRLCVLKKKRYSVRAEYQSVVSLSAFRLIHYETKVVKFFNIANLYEIFYVHAVDGHEKGLAKKFFSQPSAC